jgi:hypothetical protein
LAASASRFVRLSESAFSALLARRLLRGRKDISYKCEPKNSFLFNC